MLPRPLPLIDARFDMSRKACAVPYGAQSRRDRLRLRVRVGALGVSFGCDVYRRLSVQVLLLFLFVVLLMSSPQRR